MKRLGMLAGIAAVLAVSVVVWTTGGDAQAQDAPADTPAKISVTGSAAATVTPDQATVNVGVNVLRDTASQALADGNTALNDIVDAIVASGVSESDLQTVGLNLNADYRYDPETGQESIQGYRYSNTIQVSLDSVDAVGGVVDTAVEAGGDAATINGIVFSVSNREEIERAALLDAIDDAETKAESMAERAGVTIGRVLLIEELGGVSPVRSGIAEDAAGASTPIFGGQQEITVSVRVEYEIS